MNTQVRTAAPTQPPPVVVVATHFDCNAGPLHFQIVLGTRFVVGSEELRRDEVGVILPHATAKALHATLGLLLSRTESMFGPINLPGVLPVPAPPQE